MNPGICRWNYRKIYVGISHYGNFVHNRKNSKLLVKEKKINIILLIFIITTDVKTSDMERSMVMLETSSV